MKKSLAISYLVALHLLLVGLFWKPGFYYRLNPFAMERTQTYEILYDNILALQLRRDGNIKHSVPIFIGDSIVEGMCVTCISPGSINFGIGMDTTAGVIRRLPLYRSLPQAKVIVLAIGLNDTRVRSNAEILANYRKILALLPADRPLLFSAILPVAHHPRWPANTNQRINAINQQAEQLCRQRPGCIFLDAGAQLRDGQGRLAARYHIGDGIHPNPAGYQILIDTLHAALAKNRLI